MSMVATQHSYKNHREVVCGGLGEEAEAESVREELNELEREHDYIYFDEY